MNWFKGKGRGRPPRAGFVLMLLFCLPAGAGYPDPGFWSVDSIDVPSEVKAAGDSVFQLVVLKSDPQRRMEKAELETALAREEELYQEDLQREPTGAPSGNVGLLYQLRSCLDPAAARCDLHEVLTVGTAFGCRLDPHGIQICTSYQNVAATIGTASAKDAPFEQGRSTSAGQSGVPLDLLLVDRHKGIVFDTRGESKSAAIIAFAPGIDVALIQLSETVGRPLPFDVPAMNKGRGLEDFYILGFPTVQRPQTEQEDYYAYPLSRYELSVTIGEPFQDPRHQGGGRSPEYVECDADGAPGMSGAPVLNVRGRVVGMFHRSMSNQVGSIIIPAEVIRGYLAGR